MLKLIHKKGVIKKVLWVLTFVIIISFGFWGTTTRYDNGTNTSDFAGKIFGKKITFQQFEDSRLHTYNQALLRYGENFFKISQFLNLDAETWDRLILLHEAKRQRLKVADKDVVESIEAMPFFQRDGKFDSLLYNDILRGIFRCKPRDFEEGIRETIIISQLFKKETASVNVTDQEAFEYYKKQKEKVQVSYVLFNPENFKQSVTADEKEFKEYFEQNKAVFRVPPTINIEYLHLPLAENVSKEDKSQAEKKINQISEELKITPDLKTIGTKFGIELQESGFFSQEQPNLKIGWSYDLLQKSFELTKDQISQPVETTQGYYILRLKERRASYIPEFAEVQEKVKDAVLLEKARVVANSKAQEHLKTIQEKLKENPSPTFQQVVEGLGLTLAQTPLFNKGEYVPNIGMSKDFQDAAFALTDQMKISEVVDTPKGFCILYLGGKEAAQEEDFKKEKEQFHQELLSEKQSQAINDYLAILRIKANLQDNMADLKSQAQQKKNKSAPTSSDK